MPARYVEEQYDQHLIASKKADELAARNPAQAIEMFVQKGDWPKVFALAQKQGPEAVPKYAAKCAVLKFKQKEYAAAAGVLAKYGTNADPANFEVYRGVSLEVRATRLDSL
jgi:hypothetical protein